MKGWRPKSSVCPSKPGKSNFIDGISRDFAGISQSCPKSLREASSCSILVLYSNCALVKAIGLSLGLAHNSPPWMGEITRLITIAELPARVVATNRITSVHRRSYLLLKQRNAPCGPRVHCFALFESRG